MSRDDNNSNNKNADQDYLDLLSTVGKKADVPVNRPRTDSRDVYSDSSRRKNTDSFKTDSDDVYIGKGHRRDDSYVVDIDDLPITRKRPQSYSAGQSPAGNGYRPQSYSRDEAPRSPNRAPAQGGRTSAQGGAPAERGGASRGANRGEPPRPPKAKRVSDEEISDYEARHGIKPEKKKKRKYPIAFVIIALILAVIIGTGVFVTSTANSVVDKFKKGKEIEHISNVSALASESHVKNILLIGLDYANGGTSRSDSIILVSVNKNTGKIIMSSVLRDSYLEVPGKGKHKVNASYAWGGANLLIQTLETNFKIKIDDYATVDFDMFTALVDGIGGIDVEVTEKEADWLNNKQNYHSSAKPEKYKSGEKVHLSGYQALWYARIRYLDSDFMRTKRQRKVMTAIAENVKSRLSPSGLPGLIKTAKTVAPYIETTLTTSEFYSIALSLVSCLSKSDYKINDMLISQQIPFEDTWYYDSSASDGSVVAMDIDKNKELLYNSVYVDTHEKTTEEPTTDK